MAARRSPSRSRRRAAVALAVPLVLLAALVAVVLGVRLTHESEPLPGTTVAGVEVGGMSEGELRRELEEIVDPAWSLTVVAGDQRLRVEPAEAGYAVDLDASVQRALDAGRTGALGGALSTLRGLVSARDVGLAARVDGARLDGVVADLVRRIDRPSFAGRLVVAEDGERVDVEPPEAGRRVDQEMLRARLRDALLRRSTRPVNVSVRERPVVGRAEVDAVADEARALLRGAPLVLAGGGGGEGYRVERGALGRLLVLESSDRGRRVALGADEEQVGALVERVAEARDRPARDATLSAPPAGSVVVDGKGDVSWRPRPADVAIEPAESGRAVDREALARAVSEAVETGAHRARLPLSRVEPAFTTRQARAARNLIGTFTTYYEPGQPRVTNIQKMAETVDGTVIAPGEQFSLNGVVGERTRAKGYVPAPFISDGRLVPSVGGGVSQFSTTMYNAAYFAGLQLDAHQPHSLFIDRYPAGRESTLNYPDIDLLWTNDTDAPVLVRATAGDTSVTVSLYGDNGGRTVRARTGSRRPIPDGDFSIDVTRVVRYPDGRTDETTTTTTYVPLEE